MPDPTFPFGYTVGADGQAGTGNAQTLERYMGYTTVNRVKSEARRRMFAVMLYCYDHGVPCGFGTAYRTPAQQKATSGGASVWNSWHQGESPDNDINGLAVDVVPSSAQSWVTNQHGLLGSFGLIAFRSSNDSRDWNHEGRSYSSGATQEYWHWQPWEINYGRNYFKGPVDLQHWPIPSKYDIEVVGLRFWEHELWGGGTVTPPPVIPPPVNPPVDPQPPTQIRMVTVQGTKAYLDIANRAALRGNEDVRVFQRLALGLFAEHPDVAAFNVGSVDGDYGPRSHDCCVMFQQLSGFNPDASKHLVVDGQCGDKTWTEILNL